MLEDKKMKLSEEELRKRKGALAACYGEVRKIVFSVGAREEDVDDLVQEIMIEAYRHIEEVKNMECLNSWLYKIAKRKLIRFAVKRKKILDNEKPLSQEECEGKGALAEMSEKVFVVAHREITDEELYQMVERLKPPGSKIIDLHFAKGYTLKEISVMMGINYNTVKTIQRRTLAKLKKMILERGLSGDEDEKELY